MEKPSNPFKCPQCEMRYAKKTNLHRHLLKVHNVNLYESRYGCDECTKRFSTLKELRCHYVREHDFQPVYENHFFRTMAAFKLWKQRMESDTGSRFIAQSAAKKGPLSRGKVMYLACYRSGRFTSQSTGKRKLKSQGSVKCGRRCFASMTVVEKETGVSVVFQGTHRGHELDLRQVLLSDKEKTAISSKLRKGVSLDTVLDSVRERFDGTLQRMHLLARQDLNVLVDSRPPDTTGVAEEGVPPAEEEDECVGVQSWVQRMAREEDNPVLYFKQRGQPDCAQVLDRQEADLLHDDDFMLVVMTRPQLELLHRLGGDRICVDWTHGAQGIDLQLVTLVCVDGGAGGAFPVAYCVTSQVDRRSALTFFRCVRAAHGGPVEAHALMSDDMPALFSAWQEVMGQPRHCFLCVWSVDQAWRENIKRRIPRKKLQAFTYKALRTVMNASTEKRLEALVEAFFTWCSLEGQRRKVLTDFMEYFRQNYAQRAKVWAACYRKSAGISSSVRLEALHKVLEHCCLRGGESQRVDKLVPLLLRLTRNKVFDRLAKCGQNAEADFRAETTARHEAGLKIPRENVSCAGIGQWTVRSLSNPAEAYVVACQGEPCREACAFACPACQVCAHNTACSCPDSELRRNICQHIHAVFARTADAMDVAEEDPHVCDAESTDVQPTAAEDTGGGSQAENPSTVPPTSLQLGDGSGLENPTICGLLLHAIGQQLQQPCVEEKATAWLQPLLAAILERLNACAAAHHVALSYVVNSGSCERQPNLASTNHEATFISGSQLSDRDVTRAVLSIAQPAVSAAPTVLVRTVEPPPSTNHRPILPAVHKLAETGVSASRNATPACPAGLAALPAMSTDPLATQTVFVRMAGPPPVLASQEAVRPALVQMAAPTVPANHEATRSLFVPEASADPLATQNVLVGTSEPPVSPNRRAIHTLPSRVAKPAGSVDHLAAQTVLVRMPEPPAPTTEVACPILVRTSEPAVAANHGATRTAPARIAQPAVPSGHLGAQTVLLMAAPTPPRSDEVVCFVPLRMAEAALAANRKPTHPLPARIADWPVSADHLATQTVLTRMSGPAVSASREAVHTVPARIPKPAVSVGHEDIRAGFVLAEPQGPTSRGARHTAPARIPKSTLSLDPEDSRTVFVLAEPQVSTSHDTRHSVAARIPKSAVSMNQEDTRTVFVLAEPQVSTSHEARHTVPARVSQSAVSMDLEGTRGVFVLAEPQVSSCDTRHSVAARIPKPAVSMDHADTRAVFVLAQPKVSTSHQATHSVPAGILKPAVSTGGEDTCTVFVLAEPEVSGREAKLTVPARIPKSALSMNREGTRTVFALAEPQVSTNHEARHCVAARVPKPAVPVDRNDARTVFVLAQPPVSTSHQATHSGPTRIPELAVSTDREDTRAVFVLAEPEVSSHEVRHTVPARIPKPAVSVNHEDTRTVFMLAQPPVSLSHQPVHSVPAKIPKLAVPLDHDDTRTVFVLAQPQMSTNSEATCSVPTRIAGPALPSGHEGGHIILVPVTEPSLPTNHQSRSLLASAAEPWLSPNHEAAHTILTMAEPAMPAGHKANRSILKRAGSPMLANRGAMHSTVATSAEHAIPTNRTAAPNVFAITADPAVSASSPQAGSFAVVRTAEPPESENCEVGRSVLAGVTEPQLSPNHEAAHTILTMAGPATSANNEATCSVLIETAGLPLPADRGATPRVLAATTEPASPVNPEATHAAFAMAAEPVVSTSDKAGTFVLVAEAEPPVSTSHKDTGNVLAVVDEPGLSPNCEDAHTSLTVADPATSTGSEATTSIVPSTAGSPVPDSIEAMQSAVVKVEEPEVPSSLEAASNMFAVAAGPSAPTTGHEASGFVIVVTESPAPVSTSHEGPCSISERTAVQAAFQNCSQAPADHDYCSNPTSQIPTGFTTGWPWTTSLIQR